MTRREWLKQNPPPQTAGPLLDQAVQLEAQGNPTAAATLRTQAGNVPGKCSLHPTVPLYRHQNRQEDLFVCKQGPHFLWWTMVRGRAQFLPLADLDLPDIDGPMG